MKSVFPIVFFGLAVSACVNIDARLPDSDHPDWVEERRTERLGSGTPPPVIPADDESAAEAFNLRIARYQFQRDRVGQGLETDVEDNALPTDEFVEEGRARTGEPD